MEEQEDIARIDVRKLSLGVADALYGRLLRIQNAKTSDRDIETLKHYVLYRDTVQPYDENETWEDYASKHGITSPVITFYGDDAGMWFSEIWYAQAD